MSKRYNLIIFDLDGTILYTLEDLANSLNYMLGRFGYPPRTLEEVRRFVGNGVRNLVACALPDGENTPDFEKCFAVYREHYSAHSNDATRAYEGMAEVMAELKKRGYKIGILSNKYHSAAVGLCNLYFGGLFDIALGESENTRRKPDPDGVRQIVESAGTDYAHTVLVGDAETDVLTAMNAGIDCVSALWGYRSCEVLAGAGATRFAETPRQLLNIFE